MLKMKQEIIQRLHELSESITERHGWAVLKSHIEEIDAAIAAGVKAKAVEEALAELGLDLAPTSLRSALYRYRKKQKAQGLDATASETEKELLSRLSSLEKIDFYRNRDHQRKGVEDPI
jgi:enolase